MCLKKTTLQISDNKANVLCKDYICFYFKVFSKNAVCRYKSLIRRQKSVLDSSSTAGLILEKYRNNDVLSVLSFLQMWKIGCKSFLFWYFLHRNNKSNSWWFTKTIYGHQMNRCKSIKQTGVSNTSVQSRANNRFVRTKIIRKYLRYIFWGNSDYFLWEIMILESCSYDCILISGFIIHQIF